MAEEFDVVVIGFGFAGGIAAIEAHDAGARVLLLEKSADPGGISVCSMGGLRVTKDAAAAFAYLKATNGGTAPEPLLRALAEGMGDLPRYAKQLCDAVGARTAQRDAIANYPLEGYQSFAFVTVEEVPGFDVSAEFPSVRGAVPGANLFKVVLENVRQRKITVRLGCAAERLVSENGRLTGVIAGGKRIDVTRGVVLACGGFEADDMMQLYHWPMRPVLSAAVRSNTGDGIRMAQALGAELWHMWHFHGSYGFRHPDPAYPFGIRVKRLPDWVPDHGLREDVRMSWILVNKRGKRFANEYDPYMQDTGARSLGAMDPVTQSHPQIPAVMVLDQDGRELYPLSAPTWHDAETAKRFGGSKPRELDEKVLIQRDTIEDLAAAMKLDPANLRETIDGWNAACRRGTDEAFGRPPGSMMPILRPPFSAGLIWPVVSNTQGGPVHDERQRVLNPFGEPIAGLYAAGELGSLFGHLYMSGGNIAECFVGGRIAGREAALANAGAEAR